MIPHGVERNRNAACVLYVGEAKGCPLAEFVCEGLRRRLGREYRNVSVVPDVQDIYAEPNAIVVNPRARRLSQERGARVAVRPSGAEFLRAVSDSETVRQAVRRILDQQDGLFVWMFESRPGLALLDMPGVRLLGPDPRLAQTLNSKLWQYRELSALVPVPDYRICDGREELLDALPDLLSRWPDGVFVSLERSAGGEQSMVARTPEAVAERFTDARARYLVTRYLPHTHDPTVLAVTAGERDVFVAGVADQRIEGGNRFTGSTWPSVLPAALQEALGECVRRIGRRLGRAGYRGIFGCDFIVDARGDYRLVEVNARKQGTTMEFCCMLDQALPAGAPNLLELEYCAVTGSAFPENTAPPRADGPPLHWGTFNHKALTPAATGRFLSQEMAERDLFRRVAGGGEGGCLFLEHVGADVQVEAGCFLGRVAAVDSTRDGMLSRLQEGRRRLADSLAAR